MGEETKVSGPDLEQGIPAGDVRPGTSTLGHVGDEPVLLARVGSRFCAIAATCTHYGGPLAEGVIEGDTVRCPWHHARFSLSTGEALAAPALSPVACWGVEERDGVVRVMKKVERDPAAPTYPFTRRAETMPRHVVIVGAGAAGSAAAEMLRRCAFDGAITLIDADPDSPYDRPNLSKDYLAGNAPEEWIPLRPAGFHAAHDIELLRATVTRIDTAAHRVEVHAHAPIAYDALILATGAEPITLRLAGIDKPHVHYLRSLADSRSIIAAAKTARRAVVIGSSFIGLEVAASLRARSLEVDVVAPESLPLERILGRPLGEFVKALHNEKGVRFHLEHKPERIDDDVVELDDGTRLAADIVVIGVGVRPRVSLAEEAGLALDRGVVVDECLRTSAPDVYAAGDIARWPDPHSGERIRVEHWVVAQRMGQTAARNVLGANETFAEVPFFWSAHYDASINYVGHAERWDDLVIDGDAASRDVAVRFMLGDDLRALATIFRDEESLRAEIAMERPRD